MTNKRNALTRSWRLSSRRPCGPDEDTLEDSDSPSAGGRKKNTTGKLMRRFVAEFIRSEEHTSELQSRGQLVCRLLLEKKKQLNCLDTTTNAVRGATHSGLR